MKVVHVLGGSAAEKEIRDNEASFFLSNSSGGFAHFAATCTSKYQGLFSRLGSSLFKTLESIGPENTEPVGTVENSGHSATFYHGTYNESFFLPLRKNCLVYKLSREMPVDLLFDIRKANDFRQWGRFYKVEAGTPNTLSVSFAKKTDKREDDSDAKDEFKLFVAVKHDGLLTQADSGWVKKDYTLDRRRNSASERYVFKAATLTARTFVISAGLTPAAAVTEADFVFKSLDRLSDESRAHYNRLLSPGKGSNSRNKRQMPDNAAAVALDKLQTASGSYAGLPWFFQEWSRDELVSCVTLPQTARKKTIMKYIDCILPDGRLPNLIGNYGVPQSNADGIGWLFKRASELVDDKMFTPAETKKIRVALKKSIDGLVKIHLKNGFITNGKDETWMDTSYGDDGRAGACIEIQALQLNMYKLMRKLGGEKTYLLLENSLRQNVRKFFWNGSILADRLNDFTVRPNIFIAAYVYPELLSKKEWEACISNSLQRLWLDWGGLATIDKSHPSFRGTHTGETNESYHRGDSWFWINNIAAIVMNNVNSKKFRPYITKIVAASANDILWKGAVGCASELSSANEQKAEGCLNQAWSNATFIELVNTVKK